MRAPSTDIRLPGFPIAILTVLALFAVALPASARWNQGGTAFVGASNGVTGLRAFPDGSGGVLLLEGDIWNSTANAMSIDAYGSQRWTTYPATDLLAAYGENSLHPAGIAPDGTGGEYCALDVLLPVVNTWIYEAFPLLMRFDGSKAALWDAAGVRPFPASESFAQSSEVCASTGGGVIVAAIARDPISFAVTSVRLQRMLPDSTRAWGTAGVSLPPTTYINATVRLNLLPDGSGGVFVEWVEMNLESGWDYRVQHVSAAGEVLWPAGGVVAISQPNGSPDSRLVSDAAGGFYVCAKSNPGWEVSVWAAHFDAAGNALWPAGGLSLLNSANESYPADFSVAADGTGLTVGWSEGNSTIRVQRFAPATGTPLFAQPARIAYEPSGSILQKPRVLAVSNGQTIVAWGRQLALPMGVSAKRLAADGSELWSSAGIPLFQSNTFVPGGLELVTDGADGAIAVFGEVLNPGYPAWFAQRIEADGDLPMLSGALTQAADVPNDEGGALALAYAAPYADAGEELPEITGYNVWRRVPGSAPALAATSVAMDEAGALAELGAALRGTHTLSAAAATRLRFPSGTWESIGFHAAVLDSQYRFVVNTLNDSGPAVPNADETYVVTAHSTTPSLFGISNALAGHSRDNRAPAAPQSLAGSLAAGTLSLTWAANTEGDLAQYAVYRGTSPGFAPSPGNRLGVSALPAFTAGGFSSGQWYKVTALDRHGNESPAAALAGSQVAGVEPVARVNFLRVAGANPVVGELAVEFGLAEEGHARVTLLDAQGRVAAVLGQGAFAAGPHHIAYARSRTLGAGLYFVRIEAAGFTSARKVILHD
jgi:hypothetical protein